MILVWELIAEEVICVLGRIWCCKPVGSRQGARSSEGNIVRIFLKVLKSFVDFMSNSALLSIESHNFLVSPQKCQI